MNLLKFDKRTDEQKKEIKLAKQMGMMLELVAAKGGTGHLRKELTQKEYLKLKNRRKMQKQARKANR